MPDLESVNYRAARPEDARACFELRARTRQNAMSAERLAAAGIDIESWSADIRSGRLTGVVALVDARIVGYCFGATHSGELRVLALLPDFEARGLGSTLLGRVVEALRVRGFERLFLGCSPDPNARSYGFYRHLGWRSTGTFDAAGDEVLEYRLDQRARP